MANIGQVLPFPNRGPSAASAVGQAAPIPTLGTVAGAMQQMGSMTDAGAQFQEPFGPQPRSPFAKDLVGETPDPDGVEMDPPELADLRRQYQDYVALKQNEIMEARIGLQYYHSRQFSDDQIDRMEERKQPPIIFNRIKRKVGSIVGVLSKLRGDPKCFGRNSPDEHGAEIATQCIRYAFDASGWTAQESELLRKGCCTGIICAELGLTPGDKGDPDADLAGVDVTTYFYDPRSQKLDFSDARYMGTAKLVTRDEFEEIFPGRWEEAFSQTTDSQTQFDYDKEYLWSQGRSKLRLVEHWWRSSGEWRYAFYAGAVVLTYGVSPFYDEKGHTICRYFAFAINVDELGDHYGFVRDLKGPQDAMNQHRSKAIWIMNTRQIKVGRAALGGDGQSIERKRTEAARADGVLVWENDPNEIEVLTNDAEFLRQTQYYQDARQELDSFGPNPALVAGEGPMDVSGRSLAMQQQAALAEIGPLIDQWNGWRLRLYRAIWVQQQRNWTAERMLRVTKDMQTAQYILLNQKTGSVDQFGRPILANALGGIDVEVLMDEGPNTVNVMADAFDTLSTMGQKGIEVPPPVLIELSGLPRSIKDKVQQMMGQPDPAKQAMLQAQIGKTQAQTQKDQTAAQANQATAVHKLSLAHHEVHKAHATQQGAASDFVQNAQDAAMHPANMPPSAPGGPPPSPGAGPPGGPPAPGGTGGPGGPAPDLLGPLQAQAAPPAPTVSPPVPGLMPGIVPRSPIAQSPMQLGAGMPMPASRPQPGGPPVKAPDGHHYVYRPHSGGLYHRVVVRPGGAAAPGPRPAGGPRPVPGGPPVRAPDGNWYLHAPHSGGQYQRVDPT